MRARALFVVLVSLLVVSLDRSLSAQGAVIRSEEVAPGIYMLTGQGGNMGLCVGEDGAFLIDDQFAPLTGRILDAIKALTDKPVEFVVNTHWHGDHTGGNLNLDRAGAVIVAHENVRVRMSSEQFSEALGRRTPAAPEDARPAVTFTESMTFHWNGEEVRIFHVENAHTDGDSIIHFKNANVFHMGDTFFSGNYPYIDPSSGGNLHGVIRAAKRVLALTDADSKIIPGHGPLSTPADLQEYIDLLEKLRDRLVPLLEEGKSIEEIVASRPTKEWDEKWGNGFMKPDNFVKIVCMGLQRAKEQ